MRKFWVSKPFYILLSILLALLLYFNAIAVQNRNSGNNTGSQSQVFTATINNFPVTLDYNSDKYFVTSSINSVNIVLTSANQVKLSQEESEDSRNFKVTADLTGLTSGTHLVPIALTGLPTDVNSQVKPGSLSVNIERKVTKEFKVTTVVSSDHLPKGTTIDSVKLSKDSVKVTSGRQMIDKIDRVEAILPASVSLTGNYTGSITLIAVDSDGHPVSAVIAPSSVTMHVTVKTTSSSSSSSSSK